MLFLWKCLWLVCLIGWLVCSWNASRLRIRVYYYLVVSITSESEITRREDIVRNSSMYITWHLISKHFYYVFLYKFFVFLRVRLCVFPKRSVLLLKIVYVCFVNCLCKHYSLCMFIHFLVSFAVYFNFLSTFYSQNLLELLLNTFYF